MIGYRHHVKILSRKGDSISSVLAWEKLGKPAAENHWVEGRSAYELARDWIERDAAGRVTRLLALRPELSGLVLGNVIVEKQTYFDDQGRGPRNHDLLIEATSDSGPVVIAVESKADETFDAPLWKWRSDAVKRHPRSGGPRRLDHLTGLFFGTTIDKDNAYPALACLGYQLLSALAGTLADAKRVGASRAVLVVQEFLTNKTDDELHARNAQVLEDFLARLAPKVERSQQSDDQWISQPFTVLGDGMRMTRRLEVSVAKLVVDRRS